MGDVVSRLMEKAKEQEKQEELSKEEMDKLRECVNRLLSSEDGIFFWRKMRKVMRIYSINADLSPLVMAGEKALRNVYLSVWKLLDKDVQEKIERGE